MPVSPVDLDIARWCIVCSAPGLTIVEYVEADSLFSAVVKVHAKSYLDWATRVEVKAWSEVWTEGQPPAPFYARQSS